MGLPYNLFPLYCTAIVPTRIINDLILDSASDPYITPAPEFLLIEKRDPHIPVSLTSESEGRLRSDRTIQSDFVGASTSSIASYTATCTLPAESCSRSISVVLDERSVRDRTCLVVRCTNTDKKKARITQVRIPFTLAGCLFGVHTGLGLVMDDMVAKMDKNGVFRL
ncbi:hypothetical protein PM082_001889 [Marasmius tenuissimus]|nr:hypothetical protein PM082_001889 [Marasmius tenuissimus]